MQVRQISAELLPNVRSRLISFFKQHGDKRITRQAIEWLEQLNPSLLYEEGNCILVAIEEKKIIGVLAVADYGRQESFVAVHSDHRQNRAGVSLIEGLMRRMDKAYGRVALDNIPSLKMCLSIGMVGFKIITGPTGKPTLWLGLGNWTKEDVE